MSYFSSIAFFHSSPCEASSYVNGSMTPTSLVKAAFAYLGFVRPPRTQIVLGKHAYGILKIPLLSFILMFTMTIAEGEVG